MTKLGKMARAVLNIFTFPKFAADSAPELERSHIEGAPKMATEMRLIGKAGFVRDVRD